MSAIEAQIKPEHAHRYPRLEPGRWYPLDNQAREAESHRNDALRVVLDQGDYVEVAVDHITRREVGLKT